MINGDRQLYEFGSYRLNPVTHVLTRDGEIVALAPKVFDLLRVLVESAGEPVDKDTLMRRLWPDTFVEEGNLAVNVFALRKALGGGEDQFIKTIPRRGYCFVAPVTLRRVTPARIQPADDEPSAPTPTAENPTATLPAAAISASAPAKAGWGWRLPALALAVLIAAAGAAASIGVWRHEATPAVSDASQFAVLPFTVVSADPSDEYLGAGLAAAVVNSLTDLTHVIVRPMTSSIKFAGQDQDPVQAGRALQADVVLKGNIRKAGDSLRIALQLVQVSNGARLWEFESPLAPASLTTLHETVATGIASVLQHQLTSAERAAIARRTTSSVEAYHEYLKGEAVGSEMTASAVSQAVAHFEKAVAADPAYADGYAALATFEGLGVNRSPTLEKLMSAEAAARKALELDANLAEAQCALGRALNMGEWDWAGAERAFRRAIELSPNLPEPHFWYAINLSGSERHDEALAEMRLAQKLDPSSPRVNHYLGMTLLMARRYDEAISQFRKTPLDMGPINQQVFLATGVARAKKAQYDEALAAMERGLTRSGGNAPGAKAHIAYVYAEAGRRVEAETLLAEFGDDSDDERMPRPMLAAAFACLGDMPKAFEQLDRAYAERDSRLVFVRVDPVLDCARRSAQFQAFLSRFGAAPSRDRRAAQP